MNRLFIIFAWLWIALPLGWGVYNSALKSLPLFTAKAHPAPPLAPAPTQPGR